MAEWKVNSSEGAKRTQNPIRRVIAGVKLPTDFHKPVYSLGLGDPSVYPDFRVHEVVEQAVSRQLLGGTGNGYTESVGSQRTREALAQHFSYASSPLTADDVVLDIGGSGAIHTVMQSFLNEGDNVLIPSPGFPLYKAMADNMDVETRPYRLLPDRKWEVDLASLDEVCDERTKLLVVINPSNPCGSNYSREHLLEILQWAESKRVCVLSDEVYHNMTFGTTYYPLGSLTDQVPVFTVGALSKMFLVPGYRCGWILIYDKHNHCARIRQSILNIKNMLLHPAPFVANAIPEIFANIPQDYTQTVMDKIKERAEAVCTAVQDCPALSMSIPNGALYAMVSLHCEALRDISSSQQFCEQLAEEEGVLVIPAEAFLSQNGFRIVLCNPTAVLLECIARIKAFILRHS